MSMGNDVTKLYKAETGKDAIGAWGNDDTDNDMYCYVEGPTMDYVRWLEGRASKTGGSTNTSTNTRMASALEVYEEYLRSIEGVYPTPSFRNYCKQRLNS